MSTNSIALSQNITLPTIIVSGGLIEQKQFDSPGSVYAIDEQAIRNSGSQVNLSDVLSRIPGVLAVSRNNYAQDIQISIRGFGARAPFGLRGIRLIADGIPATIPDGQGQASTVSMTSTERIEVITGPLAQIYGNSAGGVIQTFTREAGELPFFDSQLFLGSFGMVRTDWQGSVRIGNAGIVVNYSTFGIDGYRENSEAKREQFNGIITLDSRPDTRIKLITNIFNMPYAKDPLGLTASQLITPQISGSNAIEDRSRKIVSHEQVGFVVDHRIKNDMSVQTRFYLGNRTNLQYQVRTVSNNGTWTGLDRKFVGLGLTIKGKDSTPSGKGLDWVVGFDYDQSSEVRKAGSAAFGEITGGPNRDEKNIAINNDFYVRTNLYVSDRLTLTSGLRFSEVELISKDNYLSEVPPVDGSGSVKYHAYSPVLGAIWHAKENLNVYVSYGKGFETPTLSEAAYINAGGVPVGKFNFKLPASSSRHYELGVKWNPDLTTVMNMAFFKIQTDNELVVDVSSGGKTSYKVGGQTLRQGIEVSWLQNYYRQWRSTLSGTLLHATYQNDFSSGVSPNSVAVASGNYMPAIPNQYLFASLEWSQSGFALQSVEPRRGLSIALEMISRSKVWANDINTESAEGYQLFNVKVKKRIIMRNANLETSLGIDNLFNRNYIGSLIVNQSSFRYFEPGLPRSWVAGLKINYSI